ncbi:MAG: sulfur carrier protein ThiS [Clostridia bacterium]|nr:sulfur carrier protein ThiS [Clostridia bacterium]
MVIINGRETTTPQNSMSEYLSEQGYFFSRIAVEKNGEIVKKSQYDTVYFQDGDIVEIVSFVGGG